jgi:hypothetical protein
VRAAHPISNGSARASFFFNSRFPEKCMHKANGADCQKNRSVCATRVLDSSAAALALEVQGLLRSRNIKKKKRPRETLSAAAALAGVFETLVAGASERERGTGSPRGALKASLITRAVYLGAKCLLFVITINTHTRSLLLRGWARRERERERLGARYKFKWT